MQRGKDTKERNGEEEFEGTIGNDVRNKNKRVQEKEGDREEWARRADVRQGLKGRSYIL